MKSPVSYFGSKTRLAPWVVSLIPAHRVYVEPFCGSAAVLFAKSPALHEVLNDAEHNVVNFLSVLRDQPEELEQVCRLTPYSREEFRRADLVERGLSDLERARRFWLRSSQGWLHRSDPEVAWSAPTPVTWASKPDTQQRQVDRFAEAARRLAHVALECRDASWVVAKYGWDEDTVVYADPPYVGLREDAYLVASVTEDEHRRLADVLRATPATVILSGWADPLYDEDLYRDWWRAERANVARASLGSGEMVEVVWSNRPLDGAS